MSFFLISIRILSRVSKKAISMQIILHDSLKPFIFLKPKILRVYSEELREWLLSYMVRVS